MKLGLISSFLLMLGVSAAVAPAAPQPVTFSFHVPGDDQGPFLREIWADVATPDGAMRMPAYFDGGDVYAVRVRAAVAGAYSLLGVAETVNGQARALDRQPAGAVEITRTAADLETRPAIRRATAGAPRLVLADGADFVPLGMNLAWAPGRKLSWYPEAFRQFRAEGLNWTRIWMAHWGGLNLDWRPKDLGPSPKRGELDLAVAAGWDRVIEAAEDDGVYVQVVLQHHGQWSSTVNSNWADNPWNAANPGGFLRKPEEFFTSRPARELTAAKYRYIVARWGYSPAVLAWELFNEVHWTDAMRHGLEEDVAGWHRDLAQRIRSIDVYHHLVITSTEDLRSPVYAGLDYFQPHCYAFNMLAGVRRFAVPPAQLDRPVFYGEIGDDHMSLSDAQKASGVELVPLVWASLMGEGSLPAQLWQGDLILAQKRLGELGAVARFLAATGLATRSELKPFAAVVESGPQVPLVLPPGQVWHKEPAPELAVPLDGRMPADYAMLPRAIVGAPESVAEGYPDRLTLHVDYPRAAAVAVRFSNGGARGAHAVLSIDGAVVADHRWPEAAKDAPACPAELKATVPAGRHTLVLRNQDGPDWCELDAIDLGVTVSPLAAVGRRGEDFMALWLWHREGVFALEPPPPVTGTVVIDDVPAGTWRVTWWDALTGRPGATQTMTHGGGRLRLTTPPIDRHAAVVLTRERAPSGRTSD